MYAVVATGGKQHKVVVGDVVVVEKLPAAVGEAVKFDVIFLADEDQIVIDADQLSGASVSGEVVEHFKGEKAIIFKFKKRKGYKRLKGHRQDLTRVRITEVAASGAKKKAAPKKKAAEKVEEPVAEATESAETSES